MIEWGPQAKALAREAERGRTVEALENQPTVPAHLVWIWDAYAQLDRSRAWGAGFPQPIALAELNAYASLRRLNPSEVDEMIECVQHLDAAYLERMAQRKKSSS